MFFPISHALKKNCFVCNPTFIIIIHSSVQPQGGGEQRQAHFRNDSHSHPQSPNTQPQTGLGILMNNSASTTAEAPASMTSYQTYTRTLTPEQQVRVHQDLSDREEQASSLAAAGLVADSVSYTRSATSVGQVLQAPPTLVGMPVPTTGPSSAVPLSSLSSNYIYNNQTTAHATAPNSSIINNNGVPHVESINWNLDVDSAGPMLCSGIDDIDMDFATLFDSEEHLLTADGALARAP